MLHALTCNLTDERAVAEKTCRAAWKDIFTGPELELVGYEGDCGLCK